MTSLTILQSKKELATAKRAAQQEKMQHKENMTLLQMF